MRPQAKRRWESAYWVDKAAFVMYVIFAVAALSIGNWNDLWPDALIVILLSRIIWETR